MSFLVQVCEAIALLVPDFLVLGLAAAAFFNFYCIAKVCGLARTADVESGLGIALMLAYFVTIAVNVASHLLTPARARIATNVRSESQSAQSVCESPAEKLPAQSVEQGGMFTAP
jgi:hypothetical protein